MLEVKAQVSRKKWTAYQIDVKIFKNHHEFQIDKSIDCKLMISVAFKVCLRRIKINNNALWKKYAPINKIPFHSKNVEVKWILENCFYLITYRKNIKFPQINPHVKHKSPRGGSMYSRYINLVNKKSC